MKKLIDSKVLLGFTRENNIVFGNIVVKEISGINKFSMSFDVVYPHVVTDEIKNKTLENIIDDMSISEKFSILEIYDERPSNLIKCIKYHYNELFDNSLYSEVMTVDNKRVIFKNENCGNCGNEYEIEKFIITKKEYDFIFELWETIQLREINNSQLSTLQGLIYKYSNLDINVTIEKFVNNLFNSTLDTKSNVLLKLAIL